VSRQIEKAQRKVEAHNFDIRKHLLEYDDVANDQRKVIYQQRNELLEPEDIHETIVSIRRDVIEASARRFVAANAIPEQWDLAGLDQAIASEFGIQVNSRAHLEQHEELNDAALIEKIQDDVDRFFREKEAQIGSEFMRTLEKHFLLRVLDTQWRDHLANMDYLRQGIHLRGYAQKQPKQEYKREAFELFQQMLERVKSEALTILARVRIQSEEEVARTQQAEQQRQAALPMQFQHQDAGGYGVEDEAQAEAQMALQLTAQNAASVPKVGRNDPCPCGSGKKYKVCHGRIA